MRAANFIEETTTAIAGTNGNGAVTLIQLASLPRASHAFPSGSGPVRYVIEDRINMRIESGIGTFSSNILTRARPQVTWDGAAWSDNAPTPIAFGSAPLAGNIRVRLTALAEDTAPNLPGFQSTITAGADAWLGFPISDHYVPWSNPGAPCSLVAGAEVYAYYRTSVAGRFTGAQLEVMKPGTAGAAGIKVALYALGPNGLPVNKIADLRQFDASSIGIKTLTDVANWTPTNSVWLTPGWYAVGLLPQSAVSIRGFLNSASAAFGPTPVGRTVTYPGYKHAITATGSFATGLMDTPVLAGASIVNNQGHWIGLKVLP